MLLVEGAGFPIRAFVMPPARLAYSQPHGSVIHVTSTMVGVRHNENRWERRIVVKESGRGNLVSSRRNEAGSRLCAEQHSFLRLPHVKKSGRRSPMPEESTNTKRRLTTRKPSQANQEVDAWKPNRMRGYSLSVGRRHTRALLPTLELSVMSRRLNLPAWHKPYGEALLETDPEILVKLLAATEKAVFERLLELAANNEDASDERQDIRRAIDVILAVKTRADSKTSFIGSPGVGLTGDAGSRRRPRRKL